MFGSTCYAHILKTNRTKVDPKAKKCGFVGYDSYKKGWRCMDPKTKKFVTSIDVVFDEVSSWNSGKELVVKNTDLGDENIILSYFLQPMD